jgi:cardiolipin synthase
LGREAERACGLPILSGNALELLADTKPTIDRLVSDLERAERHVHLLFYIFEPDATGRRVAEALMAAARRGVRVRVLLDATGSRRVFKRDGLAAHMRAAGVDVRPALPVRPWRQRLARFDIRNHRKIVVIDGAIGYTGSQNIVDPDYHKGSGLWVDLNARFRGPVVAQLQLVFLEDWAFEDAPAPPEDEAYPALPAVGDTWAQTVPTGPSEAYNPFPRILLAAINAAQERLVLTTPYFVPDEATLRSLLMARDRGVAVTLLLPRASDHPVVDFAGRACCERLLAEGVEVRRYPVGMLHAKTLTVDDTFAMLGSSNMDIRSFYLNFEAGVLLHGAAITRRMRAVQESYLEASERLTLQGWRARPFWRRYAESAASLLSPLL